MSNRAALWAWLRTVAARIRHPGEKRRVFASHGCLNYWRRQAVTCVTDYCKPLIDSEDVVVPRSLLAVVVKSEGTVRCSETSIRALETAPRQFHLEYRSSARLLERIYGEVEGKGR
jgi:hypothetical protein